MAISPALPTESEPGHEPTLESVLARVQRLHPRVIDLSLGRIERLLAGLGHPEKALPPVVHIAGTNAKGSTLAFLRAMLEAAGYDVHLYTSPHLVRFNERIVLAGKEIADEALIALLMECEAANGEEPITFFEIITAAAFLAFARTPADILLLETGLGGRLDATNVIGRPLLTAITPIGHDHAQFLGHTIGGIAAEKAGILKAGVSALLSRQPAEAMQVIERCAAGIGAPLVRADKDWRVMQDNDGFTYKGTGDPISLPVPALAGNHQIENAGLALACLERLAFYRVDEAAMRNGLAHARWPARLQRLTEGPLIEAAPPAWEIWLDGGHNRLAAEALAVWARSVNGGSVNGGSTNGGLAEDCPLHLITGLLESKDPGKFLASFAGLATAMRAVALQGEHAFIAPERLAAVATRLGIAGAPADSVPAALADLAAADDRPARILICGSLYLAGEILKENG
ncbi:MAG: bifunctional folylpolyglutamate synthase/dihydrofolate synthase [Alphaproteobacteria bacterium]|nr:bifunctional folylpolyglutamate synthase/dihydrofolate synthase [Alphaproteobacteria bacterium]